MPPQVAYLGMVDNQSGGWKSSYHVDVDRDDSLIIEPSNGPHAGAKECLLAARIHDRNARKYHHAADASTSHSFEVSGLPRKIRIYRALQNYPPQYLSFSSDIVSTMPGPRLPAWVRDECELLEFEMSYFDRGVQLPDSPRSFDLFVPHGVPMPAVLWIYRRLPRLGSSANPMVIG
ncbi:uncharacterized protein J3D65DRAFT_663356 [Phyllosticta citribraziliensis]|uniref:Uncharacterized protein n=1 Tax=Phyllosticta citribraziliensis TaxID=989973 RepID=A0ABR1M9U7_9PEZI